MLIWSVEQRKTSFFQLPQGQVSLCQKVARAAGRVEERQARQLALKCAQLSLAGLIYGDLLDFFQLRAQVVQKQWINDLVDVLDAGVVHPAGAPGVRVQGALKHRSENGGADG